MDGNVACQKLLGDLTQRNLGGLSFWTQPNSWHHFMSDHIVTFSVLPIDAEHTLLRTKWLVHKDAVEGVDYETKKSLKFGRQLTNKIQLWLSALNVVQIVNGMSQDLTHLIQKN